MVMYQIVVTAILVALLLNTVNNLRLLRRSTAQTAPEEIPLVSLLVPARNEACSIEECVSALAQQDYPNCEILVLDDQSEDQTAEIVLALRRRYPQVRLLRGEPLPPNWHGKAYACAQLAAAARGEWLLFVDADAVLAPGCVSVALRQAQERKADLLTMLPTMVARTLGEALMLPIIPLAFVAFLPLGLVMNSPSPLFAGALGPFLLFRRETYQRFGGHAAVRRDIVEDMRLSQIVKRHGGHVVFIDGTVLMRVRMYRSFADAWRGIAKSAFAAIDYSLAMLLIFTPVVVAFFVGPYLLLIAWLFGMFGHLVTGPVLWLVLAQIILLWLPQALLMRRFGLPIGLACLQAVTILALLLAIYYAAAQTKFGGGVVWKGRAYQFHEQPQARNRRMGRMGWANLLAVGRLLLAALLLVVGWRGGSLRIAEALLLLIWTLAIPEQRLTRGAGDRWNILADMAGGLACLVYMQRNGLIPTVLVIAAVLAIGMASRWLSWQTVGAITLVGCGGILTFFALVHAPNIALLGWLALIALAESRPVAHAVLPRLQRFRP